MTLSMVPLSLDDTRPDDTRPDDTRPDDTRPDDTRPDDDRGWAVVEIRRDGSLGRADLMIDAGTVEAAQLARALSGSRRLTVSSSALDSRVGLLQAGGGHLYEAGLSLARGARGTPGSAGQQECIGQLALVEAVRGDLHRAQAHAELALLVDDQNEGAEHARLALAWIHFERAEHDQCRRLLDRVKPPPEWQPETWRTTSRLLLEAGLLVATRRPEAATRMLAPVLELGGHPTTGWASAVLTAARADALLAAGEPHRALTLLTPLPHEAVGDACVITAAGRHALGDVRGAGAVLNSVVSGLDTEPLALQVRAWLLEAWLAQDRGFDDRARVLVDRALHAAAAEDLRAPVLRDWGRLRTVVDRDPALLHAHRGFLVVLRDIAGAWTSAPGSYARPRALDAELHGTGLTERERQVLGLLAQMYSTEEIALSLFVSPNTVKTHLKGIFGKLCVNRRVDAVRRGRQLGLC